MDAARLQGEVQALATAEGRMVGTPGHDAAKEYLLGRLNTLGLQPYQGDSIELPYHSDQLNFSNLVAVVPGRDRELPPILLGAHYDSVISSYCADDNAAAVAIALAAAESFRGAKLTRDVVIALFDAEEPPFFLGPDMGSIRFYREQRCPEGFHLALIMDLVGHDVELPLPAPASLQRSLANLLFMTGAESQALLPDVVRACLPGSELPVIATLNRNVGDMSDHAIFRTNHVPYLFLSCGQWQHYHCETDTPERLNYRKMAKIGEFVLSLCCALDKVELKSGGADTTQFEIELIETAFGNAFPTVLAALGLGSLESRADLDQLAAQIQRFVRQ